MTLCNIRDTESVRRPHKNCPRAACGPRASVWTTLFYIIALQQGLRRTLEFRKTCSGFLGFKGSVRVPRFLGEMISCFTMLMGH